MQFNCRSDTIQLLIVVDGGSGSNLEIMLPDIEVVIVILLSTFDIKKVIPAIDFLPTTVIVRFFPDGKHEAVYIFVFIFILVSDDNSPHGSPCCLPLLLPTVNILRQSYAIFLILFSIE